MINVLNLSAKNVKAKKGLIKPKKANNKNFLLLLNSKKSLKTKSKIISENTPFNLLNTNILMPLTTFKNINLNTKKRQIINASKVNTVSIKSAISKKNKSGLKKSKTSKIKHNFTINKKNKNQQEKIASNVNIKKAKNVKVKTNTKFNSFSHSFLNNASNQTKSNASINNMPNPQEFSNKIIAELNNYKAGETENAKWVEFTVNALEFGKLDISLEAKDKNLKVVLTSENVENINKLEEYFNDLRQNLQKTGFDFVDLDFKFNSNTNNQNFNNKKQNSSFKKFNLAINTKQQNKNLQSIASRNFGYNTVEVII